MLSGARIYYLRNVLHDWPDDKCVEILQNTKVGMEEQSVLLIDETALPERDAAPRAAQHDMEVLISLGMPKALASLVFVVFFLLSSFSESICM